MPTSAWTVDGHEVRFAAQVPANRAMTVHLDGGAIRDLAGNAFAGIDAWTFTVPTHARTEPYSRVNLRGMEWVKFELQ